MAENIELTQLIIAALLHDIGKFAQRAGQEKSELEHVFSPLKQGDYTHKHVLYTDSFIEAKEFFPLPVELQSEKDANSYRSIIARMAAGHHAPSSKHLADCCIREADCLSSGLDRITGKPDGNYLTARLLSVFNKIKLDKEANNNLHHELIPISKNPFPLQNEEARKTSYPELFENFLNSLKGINLNLGTTYYISSLVSILEEYTWCIPSSTYQTFEDISLYDHSITTAAIAQALWSYAISKKLKTDELKTAEYILFAGEFSGIQKYIFTGSGGKGFTKILRARSFHLQTLTRAIILDILDRLNLLPVAKIMDAGGRFMLLLPNTEVTTTVLAKVKLEVQEYFFKTFAGELQMNMTSIVLNNEDLKQENFVDKLDEINDALELVKLSGYSNFFEKNRSPVVDFDWSAYKNGECPYCKRNPADTVAGDEEKTPCCSSCKALINLGGELPKNQYAYFTKDNVSHGNTSIDLFNNIKVILYNNLVPSDIKKSLDIINMKTRDSATYQAIAAHLPQDETGEIKTFEDLANEANKENKCVPMLGILKADVDNLGLLFSVGFEKNLSVSRFANLSRMLNVFFSEYLVHVIEEKYPNIYTVFAGGDDLFVLGSWTEVIEFAKQMREDFQRFVGKNPNVTLCAGLSMAKAKLPISTMARIAEKDLDKAKHNKEIDKNSCTLFNVTTSWDEFNEQLKNGKWLEEKINKEEVTQGLVRRLLSYADDSIEFHVNKKIKKGLYISHMKYDLVRNVMSKDNPASTAEIIQTISDMALPKSFCKARMGITYALYKTRNV